MSEQHEREVLKFMGKIDANIESINKNISGLWLANKEIKDSLPAIKVNENSIGWLKKGMLGIYAFLIGIVGSVVKLYLSK